jgi:hypothetical protein
MAVNDKDVATMVVALREFVDYFEHKIRTPHEDKILTIGSEALRLPPREIHFLANELEG